jgi:hypothetical protein
MEDRNKMDQSERPNRDQETEKKPVRGSQDINRQQQSNVQQGQPQQREREQKNREEKTG